MGKVKKRMCIPKKNERVFFCWKDGTFFFFLAPLHTVTLLGKRVHFLDPTWIEKVTCLTTLQREVLGWRKWFFWIIEEEREKNGVWREMFGWITQTRSDSRLVFEVGRDNKQMTLSKLLRESIIKFKTAAILNYVYNYSIIHNLKFKIQNLKFKIHNLKFKI